MIIYSDSDLEVIKRLNIQSRVSSNNKRFKDKITVSDILFAIRRVDLKCFYCRDPLTKTWQLDHFNPRANGGKNNGLNLAPSCKWCNQMKNALDGNSFLKKCKKIVYANLDTELPSPHGREEFITLRNYPINQRFIIGKKFSDFSQEELKNF